MSTPRFFEASVYVKSHAAQHNIPEDQNPEHVLRVNLQYRIAVWYPHETACLKEPQYLPWKVPKIIAVIIFGILVGAV